MAQFSGGRSGAQSGSDESKLAWRVLMELFNIKVEELLAGLPTDEGGTIFASDEDKRKYREAVDAVKLVLIARAKHKKAEKLEKMHPMGDFKPEVRFLLRCAQVSLEIGIDAQDEIGLRRWAFYNPQFSCPRK